MYSLCEQFAEALSFGPGTPCHYGQQCKFKDSTCPFNHEALIQIDRPCHNGPDCKKYKLGLCAFDHTNKIEHRLSCRYDLRCTRAYCRFLHSTLDKRSPALHSGFASCHQTPEGEKVTYFNCILTVYELMLNKKFEAIMELSKGVITHLDFDLKQKQVKVTHKDCEEWEPLRRQI